MVGDAAERGGAAGTGPAAAAEVDYTVRLEQVFQGPMDLLLHLVREQEVEIHEIQIARIVDGFLGYLERLEELDLESAGDFLVMAATLMAIKSRSLLPREEVDLEEELDPRDELIERLIEYRRFRSASEALGERWRLRALQHPRGWRGEVRAQEEPRELDLGDLDRWDLLATYSRLLRETSADSPHTVEVDPRPLRFYVDRVVDRVRAGAEVTLSELVASLEGVPPREAVVGSFCALLELVRVQVVRVEQEGPGGELRIALLPEHERDPAEPVRRAGVLDAEAPDEAPPPAGEAAEGSAEGGNAPGGVEDPADPDQDARPPGAPASRGGADDTPTENR